MLTCVVEEQQQQPSGAGEALLLLHDHSADVATCSDGDDKTKMTDDESRTDEEKVDRAKKEFHSRRFLKMKHLQSDVTEQDIRQLLSPFDIKDVQLNRVSETAKVTLVTPECLETWPLETTYVLNHQHVPVAPSNTEGMLCVAHLPLGYTDLDFRNLVQLYGRVSRCFLMRAEATGESKGYGFVEYSSKDVAYQAKALLDKKTIGDSVLHCNWLDSSHVTYHSLHSKCLYVDHLPPDYRDLVEFRRLFSSVVNPSYCQIAMWNGRPLGFGLVEFNSPQDAEQIQRLMNNYQLEDHQIRVTFCIPGYRAMVIYNKLTAVNSVTTGGKTPLLPNPPVDPASSFDQLQAVAARNPHFFQALQNLSNGQFPRELASSNVFNSGVGKGPHSPPVHQQQPPPCGQSLHDSTLSSNPNISAALVLLLATQLQSQMGVHQPSLLGNPQLLTLVQNILKQQESTQAASAFNRQQQLPPKTSPNANCSKEATSFPWSHDEASRSLANGFQNGVGGRNLSPRPRTGYKVPLLPDPPSCKASVGLLPRPNCFPLNAKVTTPNSPCALSGSHSSTDGAGLLVNSKSANTHAPLFASSSNGPVKVPLLGDKPSFVPVRNGTRCESPVTPCTDANALKQLLPLLMSQLQQHSHAAAAAQRDVRPVSSNLIFVPPGCPSSPVSAVPLQGASGASFMQLVLQMASCLNGGMGSTGCDSSAAKLSSNPYFPHQFSTPFLGGPAMYPASPFVAAAGTSEGVTFPPGGFSTLGLLPPVKKSVVSSPCFSSTASRGVPVLPASPMVVQKLVAEIQQRGSVLGDFWQVSRGTLFKPEVSSGSKRRLHVVFPSSETGLSKRKRF